MFIIFTRRLYYKNFELFLCLLILVNFDFFHLVPRIGEFDQYQESLLVVVLFYFFEEFFVKEVLQKNNPKKRFSIGTYGKLLICYLFLLFCGVWVAYFQGQELILGIKAFKLYPLVLVYFLVLKKELDPEKFTQYFMWIAFGIAALTAIQYVIFAEVSIFYFYDNSITHVRGLDSVRGLRILEGNTIITIGVVFAFVKWLKTSRKLYLILSIFLLSHILFIIKTRIVLGAVIFTMILSSFIYNKSSFNRLTKQLYLIGFCVIIVIYIAILNPVIFVNQPMIKQTITDLEGLSRTQGTQNINIRLSCYKHYWQDLQSYWLTGRGLLYQTWSGNPDRYMMDIFGYHLTDIGVFHLIVTLGLAGGLLIFFIIIYVIKNMKISINRIPEIAFYFFLGIVMLPQIDLFFRSDHIFIFSIFTAIYTLSLKERSHVNKNSFHYTRS